MNSKIKIHCTDNDKWIDAEVISQSDGWMIVVTKPGDLKINLRRTKPNIYVGQLHGYEFVYNVNIPN